jgi:REP element-mobilizing transposase RayT
MSTYTDLTFQVVFGGKYRQKFIPQAHQDELFKYLGGTLRKLDCIPLVQGGHVDHVHLVFSPSRKYSLSKIVQEVKKSSNKFLKEHHNDFPYFTSWQVGYGGFSYSRNARNSLVNYVLNQANHHRKVTFEEEYISLLEESGIEYNPKYLFD